MDDNCMDCGVDTSYRSTGNGEYYMVHNAIWRKAVPNTEGLLCLACLSKRLGRPLKRQDFSITCEEMVLRMISFMKMEEEMTKRIHTRKQVKKMRPLTLKRRPKFIKAEDLTANLKRGRKVKDIKP